MPCWPPTGASVWNWCAVIGHISPMALYRLVCALGQQSLVAVLTRCELPLPVYILADEKHSRCLTDKVYLPTIVSGRVSGIWVTVRPRAPPPLPSPMASFNARPSSRSHRTRYGGPHRWLRQHRPRVCGRCFRGRAWATACATRSTSSRQTGRRVALRCARGCARSSTPCCTGVASAQACGWWRWASGCATLPITSPRRWERAWRARAPLVPGQESGLVCGARRPADAGESTLLDQAHNAIDRKLFTMKGFHHPGGSQAAFLTGLAHLYNLIPYQRRALHAGQCGVEVEGGRVPTRTGCSTCKS